jgi:hypothetical protein
MIDKETAKKAIARLAELASRRQINLDLTVYGGTVMMVAYNARPGTMDIDAIFRPRDEVIPIIEEVAREMNLDPNWLNDDVRVWLAENEKGALIAFPEIADFGNGLSVKRPSAKYLLAMKSRAGRLPLPGQKGDYDDLVFLLRHTQTKSVDVVDKLVEKYFLGDCLSEKNRAILELALKDAFPS